MSAPITQPITMLVAVFATALSVACGGTEDGLAPPNEGADEAPDAGPDDGIDPPVDGGDVLDPGDEQDEDTLDPSELLAPFDNDSLQAPAVSEFLRPTGLRELLYIDQVSAEAGDGSDFIEFELPNNSNPSQRIRVRLDCEFEPSEAGGQVRATLFENGEEDPGNMVLCNDGEKDLTIDNTKVQTARVHFSIPPDAQTLVTYHLTVIGFR